MLKKSINKHRTLKQLQLKVAQPAAIAPKCPLEAAPDGGTLQLIIFPIFWIGVVNVCMEAVSTLECIIGWSNAYSI